VLADHAAHIAVIHRGPRLDAQKALRDKIAANRKVELVPDTVVEEILGEDAVSGVRLRSPAGPARVHAVAGVFVAVGLVPNTDFVRGLLALDGAGHIETDADMRTSVGGIFAAGDIRKFSVALLAAAAGDGATAAISAVRYLARGR
jgi:thioredoxin reductase (NADPH)